MPNDDRQRDAEVAERIMGWTKIAEYPVQFGPVWAGLDPQGHVQPLPKFTTDASAAEHVVVAMIDRGYDVTVSGMPGRDGSIEWCVSIETWNAKVLASIYGSGPTAAPCICRCALDAVDSEKGAKSDGVVKEQ